MRYLAIDYGLKRTGVAICDSSETLATPLVVLEGQGGLESRIAKIVAEQHAESIVIGLPLNMDGTEGSQARRVQNFAEQLKKTIDLPVEFHDERLSSFEAEQKLAGLDLTRKKKKKHLDSVAAAAILQSFLNHKK